MSKSLTKKFLAILFSVLVINFLFIYAKVKPADLTAAVSTETVVIDEKATLTNSEKPAEISLYDSLNLGKLGLSRQAFNYAMEGYTYLSAKGRLQNERVLSIVDFSLPSSKKRLFIIDMKAAKVLFNTYVSHGRNSGRETASSFSNDPESFKSSLGFYITRDTYSGKHGFSLRLDGQEKGFNDNALGRAIVMHPATYVDESLIRAQGFIGRSLGCPAVPEALHKPIIEKIKNGSCLFLFSPDKNYAAHSKILNRTV